MHRATLGILLVSLELKLDGLLEELTGCWVSFSGRVPPQRSKLDSMYFLSSSLSLEVLASIVAVGFLSLLRYPD